MPLSVFWAIWIFGVTVGFGFGIYCWEILDWIGRP